MKRVALIACGKTKAPKRSPARELYRGDLFRKSLRYAEEVFGADEIFVLSAKYELLPLGREVAPYEKTLKTMPIAERRAWAKKVVEQLRERTDLEHDHFAILAGMDYRRHLVPHLRHFSVPMEGLYFGQQLEFLKRALEDE